MINGVTDSSAIKKMDGNVRNDKKFMKKYFSKLILAKKIQIYYYFISPLHTSSNPLQNLSTPLGSKLIT